ncbi:MerR family transcriptional regulator [Rhodopseudomonas boonkerdii]|nr:MerR family transcriptional regulator [Rhodopseudomonas boonkerdii]
MDKAPDAFRTISEVADDLDIPQHVLRFWETRFTQIKPMKRSGGRRYYRPDDVDLLRGIRRLLYGEGYTIRGVQRILKENGIKAVQGLADEQAAPGFAPVRAGPRMSSAEPIMTRPVARRPVVEDEPEEEVEGELEEEFEDEEAEDEGAAGDAEEEEAGEDDSEEGDEEEEAEEADEEDGEDDSDDEASDDDAEEEEAEPESAATRKAPDVVVRRETDMRRPAGPAPEVRTDPAMRTAPRVEPRLQQAIGRTDPATMSRANPTPQPRANPAPQPRLASQPSPQPRPARSLDRERLEAVLEELLAARRALDAAMKEGGN